MSAGVATRPESGGAADDGVAVESPRRRVDNATTLLIIYLFLLILIPSRLVLPGLGAAGAPASVFAVGLFLVWCLSRVMPGWSVPDRQIGHGPIAIFFVSCVIMWGTAWLRGVPGPEGRAADRFILASIGFVGVALVTMDGVRTRAQLERVLMGACWLAAIMSSVGVVQFVTNKDVTQYIRIPGLHSNQEAIGLIARAVIGGNRLDRVNGTALHYIEFTAILALLLPVAMHYVIHTPPGRLRKQRIFVMGLIAVGIPLAISRSGIVGLVVAMLVMLSVWRAKAIGRLLLIALPCLVVFRFAFRGVIGTITSLFTNWGKDDSISGRTKDYAVIREFFAQRPWFGRGGGTFIPDRYITLDNQYLGRIVEGGLVGLFGMIVILVAPVLIGRHLRRRASDPEAQHLGQVFAACGAVVIVLSGTFDSLGFPTFAGLTFFLFGAGAALWRMQLAEGQPPVRDRDPGVLRKQADYFRWVPEVARRR
ncbi:MAG: O-antigen ligase family protein [Frankiales bacterium]|nr:O-antigen ligase family protein [Frankiales bacterium]